MTDLIEISKTYDINFIELLTTGLMYGFLFGFTVVLIALGIKYSLKLFAKS